MSETESRVQIHLNGELRSVPAAQPLTELIEGLGLPPQTALVEHNGQAVFRRDWELIHLAEGDRLEIMRVVAGG